MNPFERLAPFIKEFIWKQGWTELRQMQGEAINAILDSDGHLLLAGATASGKTEAAFLPILTDLHENPSISIGVLYVGPLKALINDQFQRLDLLLEEAGTPVWPWHGDVPQSIKNRALASPAGVMQTTPESLEGFLLYRSQHLPSLFGDLRYVVIDEAHAFMASDRGRQVLCQLARLEQLLKIRPRRIGLSATLGDYQQAEAWLAAGSNRSVTTIDDRNTKRRIRLALAHYQVASEESAEPDTAHTSDQTPAFMQHLYGMTQGCKSLVFVNSRAMAEEIGAGLRDLAGHERRPDIYHVHHGSISKDYRNAAEEAMREEGKPACTVATVTLELGIDLGALERVVQVGPTSSVSSFVQRLGRTGRRGQPGDMVVYTLEDAPDPTASPLERMPWTLLLAIATIQLYLEERWVEPTPPPDYPLSLLYHQTMSILAQHGDLPPAELAQRVLTLPPFRRVPQDTYKSLLRHLLETDHLQWTERKRLLIGLAGEKVVNDWRFLATFPDTVEYDVLAGAEHIGTLARAPAPTTVVRLAGRSWLVKDVDERQRVVLVERSKGKAKTTWTGEGGEIHDKVVQCVKRVLDEDSGYAYLQEGAVTRLLEARSLAREAGITREICLQSGGGKTIVVPWCGSRDYRKLQLATIARLGSGVLAGGVTPFFFGAKAPLHDVREVVTTPIEQRDLERVLDEAVVPRPGKFDGFIPFHLLREAYLKDHLESS